ncbi:MAG: alpha/beta hydrolase [Planctomycetota bacterium]|nr:MAG: alpha/beta hydrolase [Planctomycetota bacterium]
MDFSCPFRKCILMSHHTSMRFPFIVVPLIAAAAAPVCLNAAEREFEKSTYVYKTVDDLEIKLDAYVPDGKSDAARPVAVWIHGGALINGHREGVSGRMRDALLQRGIVLISIDYRLAPETKVSGIHEDVKDAFAWIREEGPAELGIDPDRLAVHGGSAGGHLTLVTGYLIKPRPQALVAFWGYGDIVGPWLSEPSPHARHATDISQEAAWKQVSGPPVSDSRERDGNGGAFYRFCRREGIWPKAVTGWDPDEEPEEFIPYMPLLNVSEDYPPTLMIHGTEDTDVPYEQSVLMADAFEKHGVEHRLITVEGGEHGLAGAEPDDIDAAYEAAVAFIVDRIGTGD